MADLKGVTLARMVKVEVSSDLGVTYATLSGVMNFSPKMNTKTDDITTYDSNGVTVIMPVGAEYSIDIEGVETFDITVSPYVLDAGLSKLYTAAQQYGEAARLYFRVTHTDVTNYSGSQLFSAYVSLDNQGGGDGAQKWKGKLQLTGRPTGTGYWAKRFGVA